MKEKDIRPQDLYKKYVELCIKDTKKCFGDDKRIDIPCVACGSNNKSFSFQKDGFSYYECYECSSLFQNPRPTLSAFEAFYRNSESSNYWAEVFFPATMETRRNKIFKPRVDRLIKIAKEINVDVKKLIDVGAGFGIFLEEWQKVCPDTELIAIEPSNFMAKECRDKGFQTEENIVEEVTNLDNYADLVVCFEVLEHVYEPLSFIKHIKKLARPGGLVFISTLSIDGFDLQILGEKSTQISPPHHINFLSIEGFKNIFKKAGLVNINVTTPGRLDVDIIRNAISEDTIKINNNFLSNLILNDNHAPLFQKFLAENCLSSHAWIIGKVPE